MIKISRLPLSLLFFVFLAGAFLQAAPDPSSLRKNSGEKILINHRILAKINGKPITTYDLMKQMDITFYKRYPEYASSVDARYQFYIMAWKHFLNEAIDKELILKDAKDTKVAVTAGDVRQEMETTFGPNIAANLDKIGLSFDDAYKLVEESMVMERMIAGRVHTKALRQITPIKIREEYDAHILDPANTRSTEWTYRCLTIKDRDLKKSESAAATAKTLLEEGIQPEEIQLVGEERGLINKNAKITLSKPIKSNEQELSESYKQALADLEKGQASAPFQNKSRSTQANVYKILIVDEKVPGGVSSFTELEPSLKNRLLNNAVDKETEVYLEKLREDYHVRFEEIEKALPENYEPFSIIKN